MTGCWMRLTNGWTVSISDTDTPPAICSVAAWPSRMDEERLKPEDYFDFDGRAEQRCFSLADVRQALSTVSAAEAIA